MKQPFLLAQGEKEQQGVHFFMRHSPAGAYTLFDISLSPYDIIIPIRRYSMKDHKQLLVKIALALAVIFLFGGFYLASPATFYEIWHLLQRGEILRLQPISIPSAGGRWRLLSC